MINVKKIFVLAAALVLSSQVMSAWAQEATAEAQPEAQQNVQPATEAKPEQAQASAQPEKPQEPKSVLETRPEEMSQPAILLKINNIKSIKDAEGLVVSCDFNATIYNRSKDTVSSATVDLSWTDETIEAVLADEAKRKELEEEKARLASETAARPRLSRRSRREATPAATEANTAHLSFSLDIPEIKPYEQVVISSNIKTDKCFLLVKDAVLDVKSCNASAAEGVSGGTNPARRAQTSGDRSSTGCSDMFEFVSSKDPQYYRDFKAIDLDAERKAKMSRHQMIKQEVEADYQRAMQAMDAIAKELDTIQ